MAKPITARRFVQLTECLVGQIKADRYFTPTVIVGLTRGGLHVAAEVSKQLGIPSHHVGSIAVRKDGKGGYFVDETFFRVTFTEQFVLILDDSSGRGKLAQEAVAFALQRGAKVARSGVLIANKSGIQPNYVAEVCTDTPPDFKWC